MRSPDHFHSCAFRTSKVVLRVGPLFFLLLLFPSYAWAQKKVTCPDGNHYEIDPEQFRIKYEGSSFTATLKGLSILGARLTVTPQKLQEAAAATQQWDVFLQGLAAGYNSCAVTKQQYAEGLQSIYPRLKGEAADLEQIRRLISEGKKADEKRLQSVLDRYFANLRRFAQLGGNESIMERIEALTEHVRTGQEKVLEQQKSYTEQILAKLTAAPQPRPAESQAPLNDRLPPSLLDLFKTDFAGSDRVCMDLDARPVTISKADSKQEIPILPRLCFDYAAKSKFAALHIPSSEHTFEICKYIADKLPQFVPFGVDIDLKDLGQDKLSSKGFHFSGRIFIYYEDELSHKQLGELGEIYSARGLTPVFRGMDYLQAQFIIREKAK